jgi:hypothetical protein
LSLGDRFVVVAVIIEEAMSCFLVLAVPCKVDTLPPGPEAAMGEGFGNNGLNSGLIGTYFETLEAGFKATFCIFQKLPGSRKYSNGVGVLFFGERGFFRCKCLNLLDEKK